MLRNITKQTLTYALDTSKDDLGAGYIYIQIHILYMVTTVNDKLDFICFDRCVSNTDIYIDVCDLEARSGSRYFFVIKYTTRIE